MKGRDISNEEKDQLTMSLEKVLNKPKTVEKMEDIPPKSVVEKEKKV